MSKKTKKSPAPRKAGQNPGKPAAARPAYRGESSRHHPAKAGPAVNLTAVRVVAAVLGVLVLVGLVVMALGQQDGFQVNEIVTLVLLVVIVGISAYTAARPGDVTGFFQRLAQ